MEQLTFLFNYILLKILDLVNGLCSKQMEVPVVKIKNIVKGSIIGIGGHLIKDVIGNFHKVLAEKVIFP